MASEEKEDDRVDDGETQVRTDEDRQRGRPVAAQPVDLGIESGTGMCRKAVQLPNVSCAAAFLQNGDPSRRNIGRRDEQEDERAAKERARAAGNHTTADHRLLHVPIRRESLPAGQRPRSLRQAT